MVLANAPMGATGRSAFVSERGPYRLALIQNIRQVAISEPMINTQIAAPTRLADMIALAPPSDSSCESVLPAPPNDAAISRMIRFLRGRSERSCPTRKKHRAPLSICQSVPG
jgi:hypothetical protein